MKPTRKNSPEVLATAQANFKAKKESEGLAKFSPTFWVPVDENGKRDVEYTEAIYKAGKRAIARLDKDKK